MQAFALDSFVPSGGDAGGVTGVVNLIPPGFGCTICLCGIVTGEDISRCNPVIEIASVEVRVAGDTDPSRSTEGGGVGVLLGSSMVVVIVGDVRQDFTLKSR